MERSAHFPSITVREAFVQFLEGSSFAQRTRESYAEDLKPLLTQVGQALITALTDDVARSFLATWRKRWLPRLVQSTLGGIAQFQRLSQSLHYPASLCALVSISRESRYKRKTAHLNSNEWKREIEKKLSVQHEGSSSRTTEFHNGDD